jgi:hypothetical protein
MGAFKEMQALELDTDYKQQILQDAVSNWGTDYEMVLYEYENQLEAYEKINN